MPKSLVGKEVTAIAASGLGSGKKLQGELFMLDQGYKDIPPYFYLKIKDETTQDVRHVWVLEHTIKLVEKVEVVDQNFLCFTEEEAGLLKEITAIAIPFWNVAAFLSFAQSEIGDAAIPFMQKLDLISKKID